MIISGLLSYASRQPLVIPLCGLTGSRGACIQLATTTLA